MLEYDYAKTPAGNAFTRLLLETFRFNGMILAAGDELTKEFGLTSSLWQVLGAVGAMESGPQTVAQIARGMGLTRQSVQRSAKILERRGLITFEDNPEHKRARLVTPTPEGRTVLDRVMAAQAEWANRISAEEEAETMDQAVHLMRRLSERL